MATILMMGAFDTKGLEYAFLREELLVRGHQVLQRWIRASLVRVIIFQLMCVPKRSLRWADRPRSGCALPAIAARR